MAVVLNDLYDYGPKIYQDENKFKFSLDSLLLSEFVEISNNDKNLLDLCSGNAPLPLIIASGHNIAITGVELQEEIYNLANKSISYNNFNNKIKMLNINAKDVTNYFPGNNFDIITCNPPFFKTNESSLINENYEKAVARHELTITFAEIVEVVSKMLRDNGKFYFVHRPERLEELINLCSKEHLTIKKIVFIYSKEETVAKMVLIKCVKNAKLGMKVESKLVNRNLKTYQNLFK